MDKKDNIKMYKISAELKEKIRKFTAIANNHVMSLPVSGDDILHSADIMKQAQDIVNELDQLVIEEDN